MCRSFMMMAGLPGIHKVFWEELRLKSREIDIEWVLMIKEALESGITKEEIREFLNGNSEAMTYFIEKSEYNKSLTL